MKKSYISRGVYIAILLPLVILMSQAQVYGTATYRFLIKDKEDHSIISNAIVHAISKDGKIIGYKLSNEKGVAELVIKSKKTQKFRFSLLGYEMLEVPVDKVKEGTSNEVFLEFGSHQLQEITVTVPPIKEKGDTIVYNASSFVGIEDNYLDDLLKKLPGITVSTAGVISYQGNPISKFYIEGQDLLGSRYNQITQNLTVDAVSNVEVLENHQHIKMLKDKAFTDKAALNIKLKEKFKLRPVGEVTLGAGASPFLWNAELFATQISKHNQFLLTGKTNNSGDDLANSVAELIKFGTLDNYQLPPPPFLSISNLGSTLQKERWLMNEAYSFGTNYLYAINEDSNLKLNIVGYLDEQDKDDYNSMNINGPHPIIIEEGKNFMTKWREFVPSLTYEYNSTSNYLLNELKYKNSRTKQRGVINNQSNQYSQNIIDDYQYIENSLKSTFDLNETLLDLMSFTRYHWREETLQTLDDTINQTYKSSNFVTNNSLSSQVVNRTKHKLFLTAQSNYEKNQFRNSSKVNTSQLELILNPKYTYSYQDDSYINLVLPIKWNHDQLTFDEYAEKDHTQQYFSLSPKLFWTNKFNQRWIMSTNISYSRRSSMANFYSLAPTMRNYRTIYESPTTLLTTKSFQSGIRVQYRNLLKLLFANFSASFTHNNMDHLWDYTFEKEVTRMKLLNIPNQKRSYLANISVDKSITAHRLTLKGDITYSGSQYVISQNGVLVDNLSNTINYSTTFNWQLLKWMHILYSFNGASFWQNNKMYDAEVRSIFSNKLKFFFSITPKLQTAVRYEHNANQIESDRYVHNHFFDADLKYKASSKIEFTVRLNNLFNNNVYEVYSQSGLNTTYYKLPLRGRELLASFKWKF